MLSLYDEMFSGLHQHDVKYASWKNNHKLDESLFGIDDIDLLVHKGHRSSFESIIKNSGFVEGYNKTLQYPMIKHYYGLDKKTKKICHLHVYYELITGTSHCKEFMFNFSEEVLNSRFINKYKIYEVGYEYQSVLYLLRYHIKKTSIFGYLFFNKEKEDYDSELKYIKENLSECQPAPVCCSSVCSNDIYSLNKSSTLLKSFRVRYGLRFNKRLSSPKASLYSLYFFAYRIINKILLKNKKRLNGLSIAICGLDGSGKSTLHERLTILLAKNFDVKTYHVGRPKATLLTFPVRLVLKLKQKFRRYKGNSTSAQVPSKVSFIYALRYLILAYERAVVIRKINRDVLNGYIVITDRYPSLDYGLMDSPRIDPSKCRSNFTSYLSKAESYLYHSMYKVEHALKLNVSVDTSVVRNEMRVKKDKETEFEIRERHRINGVFNVNALNTHNINAEKSAEEVFEESLEIVWKAMQ